MVGNLRIAFENIAADLEREGKNGDLEALLKKKIDLFKSMIRNEEKYKQCIKFEEQGLSIFELYCKIKDLASEENAMDTQRVHEWEMPIVRKIEEYQNKLENVPPENLERSFTDYKITLLTEVIGDEKAQEIDKNAKSPNDKLEKMEKIAKRNNPIEFEFIDNWDLTDEQKTLVFIRGLLYGHIKITVENMERLKQVKAELSSNKQSGVEDSYIRRELKEYLKMSIIDALIHEYDKRGLKSQDTQEEKGEQK